MNKGHLTTIELRTPLNKGHLATMDTFLVTFWMLNDPSTKDISIKRTTLLVPMVSVIEGSTLQLIYKYCLRTADT